MKDLTRQGIYRLVYDMVKADNLITQDEIEFMEHICEVFKITIDIREEALNLTLADAMREVKNLSTRQATQFLQLMQQLTLKDGTCYREEALLLIAVTLCMDINEIADIVSVPHSDMMIDKNQVVFIENGYDEEVNSYIIAHYSHIVNSFRIGGFDFIYIPKVIEQLCSSGDKLLYSVVEHLVVRKTKEENVSIVNSIKGQTTEKIYREIILGKLGFDLDLTEPSLLIWVGSSIVNGKRMENYLVVKTEEKIATQIDLFIDRFLALQKSPILTIRNSSVSPNAFIYSGFYRILFDLITYRKGVRCDIVIHPFNHKNVISIRTASGNVTDEQPLIIGPKESAFYVFLIYETLKFGGFNIACNTAADIRYIEEAQKRFEKIYFKLCNRDTAPDITNPEIRRPMLSKIKKAVESHPTLVQKMMFSPEITKRRVIKVHVGEEHLKIDSEKE